MPGPDVRKVKDEPRTGPKPGRKSKAEYVGDMAKQLYGLHQLAQMLTGFESVVISEHQAAELAEPFYDVCIKWGIPINGFVSPEFKLICAAGAIYGPMAMAMSYEVKRKQAEAARPMGDANVVYPDAFNPPPAQAPPDGMAKAEEGAVDLSLVGQPASGLQAGE